MDKLKGFKKPDYQYTYSSDGVTFDSDVELTQDQVKTAVDDMVNKKPPEASDVLSWASIRRHGSRRI